MPTYGLYLSTLVHEFIGIYVRKLSYLNLDTETLKSGELKLHGFEVLVRDEAENKVFPPKMKSSGINNIITIIILMEFLKYLIENYSDRGYKLLNYLFVIDEPELYLHPKIQKNLINYLYSISQIDNIFNLISTHSPYIIHKNAIESTYLVDYDISFGTKANRIIEIINSDDSITSTLRPIEDSLGLKFNEFLHPIIFVEGNEEYELFRNINLIYKYTHSIRSMNGKNKFSPIAMLCNEFKDKNNDFFIFLDADFNINNDFKSVENSRTILENLSEHIFFIGKEIYKYNEYELDINNDECLEDFIIYNIFDDKDYEFLKNSIKMIWSKYFNLNIENSLNTITNFNNVIKKLRGILKSNKKHGTHFLDERILSDEKLINMKYKELCHFIETEIKEEIKKLLLNDSEKFNDFENAIYRIIK